MKLSRFLTRLGMPRTAAPADPTTTPEFKAWFGRSVVVNSDGSPKRVLHGSTHTFDRFDPSKGDEEGYYGAGLYFSDDPDDVNRHYGRPDGADLTSRIERRAEEIQNTFEDTWDEEKQGPLPEGWTQQHALAMEQAKKELVGAHEGTVYLTYLKMLKPVLVTPYGGTHFAGGRWNPRNEDEWMDSRDSSRLHAAFLRAANALGGEGQDIWDEVSSSLSEFGIDDTSAFDLEKAVRGCNAVSECRGGAGSFMGLVYRLMGFDGVIMDATVTFPGMKLNTGTMHYIVWKPTQVKSALGNAGTFNPRSPRMVAHREAGVYDGYCPICGQAGCNGRCVETRKRAKLEHDIEDASGRVVTCSLRGDKGPSFDIQASVEGTGLQAEVSVISAVGRWNHGTKPFVLHAEDKGSPLATTQDLINQVWQVLEQEYRPLIDAALAAKDRTNAALTDRELRNRKQEIMGDLVDAFVKKPGNKWTGWKQPKASKTASTWKKAAEGLVVDSPSVDQFYSIAAKIMGQDVKTFDTFLTKLRQELGPQFPAFLKALGGYAGLRPVWDAVIERDEDDLKQSLEHMRISPRKPTAAETVRGKARETPVEDAHGENRLQPDLESMSRDEKTLAHNVSLMEQYPNFQGIAGQGTPQEQAEAIIEIMKDNLIWLYNAWGKGLRERSRMWYVGGNRITHRWAKRFGIDPHKIAGVLAALSPQQQWFQNVTLAERMISALKDHADKPWDKPMTERVMSRDWGSKGVGKDVSPKMLLPELEGKTLNDFKKEGSLYKQAIWIRAWDEAHNPNMCREVTPEGEFGDWFRTNDGKPVANRWQSFSCLMKALQVLETSQLRHVSDLVGENHKVRSFYNNLIAPDSEGGDVTIDTHAVAAALLRPLSSSSREVLHNFGSGLAGERGPASSNITGATGLYGFYAEAYRRAAKATGVKPRELQSITWESVRGLFRPEDKRKGGAKMQSAVDKSWEDHSRGRIHADTAREQILNHAGGIDAPSWSVPHSGGDEGSRDSSYQGELSGDGIPGSGGTSGRGTGGRAASRVSALEGARRVVAKFLNRKQAEAPYGVHPEPRHTVGSSRAGRSLQDLGGARSDRRNSTGADHRSANACGTEGLLRTASRAVQIASKFLQPKTASQLRYVRLANTPKNRALLKDTVVGDTHIDNAIQMDFLKDMDDLILAYEGETIVGALSYGQGPAFGEVTISHIGTSRPGEGIGKALMSKLPPATKSYYVLAEPQSFGFYEALGFVDAVDSPDWGQAEDGNKPMRKTGSTAEAETLEIRERSKTPEARRPHTFQAAEWTHPNGHPRCRICGDEEREGGRCSGAKTASTSCTQCGGPTRNCKCAALVHASQGLCHGCWRGGRTPGPGTPVTAYAKEEAWMSPEGELNDVSGEGHQAGAANILGHYPVDEMPAGEQGGAILNTDFADTDFSSMLMEQGWARVAFESNITVLEGNTPTQAMMESLQSALMSRPSSPNDVVWWEAKKPYHRSARVSLQSFLSLNKMSDVWRLKEASMRTATSDELGRVARVEPGSSAPLSSPPASLFHGTPIPNAIEIMQSNSLTDGIHWGRPNEPHGPRFTTSLEVAKEFGTYPWGGDNLPGWAVFELDGHALAKAYTLVEYHDTGADGGSFGEEDEVAAVTSAISPLSRFLKAVHLSPIPKDELGYIADFVADTLEVPKATWLKEYRELLRSPKIRRVASTEATTRLDEPVVSYSDIAKVVAITIGDSEVAAHVVPERSQAIVGNLWAAQRGTGIGTRLMLALCDWCKAHGIKFITGTDVSPNRESSKIRQKLPGKSLLFQRKFEEDNAPSGADIWPDAPDAMKAILRSITPDPSGNVMVTKLAKLLRSKTAAVDPMASVRKFMHLLPTGMPLPEIKIEDTPSKGWLGRCVYTYGSPSTTIHLQKVILTDQDTLDRVVAHELCHHAEFLESAEAAAAKGWSPKQHAAMDKFLRRSHGTPWQAWADKFNAIYGANFVTERSDEAMVKADATKTIYVLLWKRGDSLLWSYAVRPSAKQVAIIKDNLAQGPEKYRYVTTLDVDFVQGTPVGRGWSRTNHDGLNEKLQKLWDSAPQVKVASETIEDGVYSMPLDEAIEEHVALVDALESPSHEDDAEEAKEQGAELKEMLEAKAKEKTAAGPGDVIATSDELTAWMDRFLDAHLDGGSVEALIVSDTDARLSFLAGPDLQGDDDAYMSFSEAFNKRVVTSRYPIAKVNGGVLARWALTKLDGDMAFPIHATMKAQGLKLPPKLTAAQIASGALDKALTGPKNSLYWFWALRLWASRNYPQVGIEGSSRLAYALDKDHAFKIAKNAAGVAQNLTESHVAQNLHDLPITQVHHVVKEGAALVVDLAHELNEQHFFQDFGLSFHDFSTAVAEMAGAGLDEKRAIEDSLPPKAGQLLESLRRHRLPVSDLIFEHQWGDFHNHAVILDYGLSHEVYQEHYRKGAKFLQPKQAAGTATIPPKLAPHVQATGGLGAAATWHTKVWLGNSGTKDHTEVGMVAFDPETGTIVPVASSDEHQNGWDLIRYLKGKKIIPDLPYVTVFLSANYVDTESPEEVAKALKAYTAWRQLGGANITVCSRYRSGHGFRVSMDDFIKAKGVPDTSYAPGKLTPVADRLVKALQVLGKGYAALHTNPGARVPKSLLTAARAALTEFKHTGMCGWAQLQSATENLLTLEAGGDPTPFEQSVYTMNGLKNTIHNQLRKFGENQFTDRDLVEVFGDPGLAKAAFDSLAEG